MAKMPWLLLVPLLSTAALGAEIAKTSSLAVSKNSSGTWTATCDIALSGIDPSQTYSGRIVLYVLRNGANSSETILDSLYQVDPISKTWTESSPGYYTVAAKLKGRSVSAVADAAFAEVDAGDRFICGVRIDSGTQPAAPGSTIFGTSMDATVQTI